MIIPYVDVLREFMAPCCEAYVVGGTVRDFLLNRERRDYDFALCESPFSIARGFADAVNGTYIVLHEGFPTARVVKRDCVFDFTSFRGDSLETDLKSRDFTLNALAISIFDPTEEIIDVTGGVKDIDNRQIRMVSRDNLAEDPLRLLRAFRFAAELGFAVEPDTMAAVKLLKGLISRAAVERIWAELKLLFNSAHSAEVVKSAFDAGLLFELLPELAGLRGLSQNLFHHLDAFDHTMASYEAAESIIAERSFPDLEARLNVNSVAMTKLAVLLHDVGKYMTVEQLGDGQSSFHGHEGVSAEIAADMLGRLKASTKEIEFTTMLVKNHMRIYAYKKVGALGLMSMRKPLIRLFNAMGDSIYALVVLWAADSAAKPAQPEGNEETLAVCRAILEFYESQYLPRKSAPRFITGRDLIETYGLMPSPLFGEILGAIEMRTLEGLIESKAKAAALVDEFLKARVAH